MNPEIIQLRNKIDIVDRELTRLLDLRTGYAIEIGKVKARQSLDIYDPKREVEVVNNVKAVSCSHLGPLTLARIFERIIDETRSTEREISGTKEKSKKGMAQR